MLGASRRTVINKEILETNKILDGILDCLFLTIFCFIVRRAPGRSTAIIGYVESTFDRIQMVRIQVRDGCFVQN
jgi:hypothetical protein